MSATVVEEEEECVGVGDLFMNVSYLPLTFAFGGYTQTVDALNSAATELDLTGQIIWPGAQFLSWYLVAFSDLLAGQVVLELGSGAGLTGLLCTQLAKEVILTDGIPEIVTLLEANAAKYGSPAATVSVRQLEWGVEASHKALLDSYPDRFRVVIGADVVFAFFPDSISYLFEAVKELLHPDGVFVTAFVLRNEVYQKQASEFAAAAGLIMEEADVGYLPSPLPTTMAIVLQSLRVKILVFGYTPLAMAPWLRRSGTLMEL